MKKRMTDSEVEKKWKEEICNDNPDPHDEHDWHSMWIGFVIALGRRDLADYSNYMKLGFVHEVSNG